ncbi:hypothetical protein MHM95_12490 [Pseudoalteromonas sp. CnMc7-15]|uniref:hypothetical protein n=1 Tax=unclassified Pseudoalteromonas TaxID=194690 RepID=UPI001EF46EAB|nr:hypothetical protein [Pseudoalteromonas sp. CnMc7-15]MCG7567099.1 hypothetical protein [Pseudoalteromonas sp. CnMc7-15]
MQYIDLISFTLIFLLFGGIGTYILVINRKRHALDAPSGIVMLKILYKYKDMKEEPDIDKRVLMLDEFEQDLAEFIGRYEELEQSCNKVNESENVLRFSKAND